MKADDLKGYFISKFNSHSNSFVNMTHSAVCASNIYILNSIIIKAQ